MTLWLVPVWAIPMCALALALIGVLTMLIRAHHGLPKRVTTYSEQHADALQRRVQRIVAVSAEQRETLTRSLAQSDEISAETRAMRAVLDAEAEGKSNADTAYHGR